MGPALCFKQLHQTSPNCAGSAQEKHRIWTASLSARSLTSQLLSVAQNLYVPLPKWSVLHLPSHHAATVL